MHFLKVPLKSKRSLIAIQILALSIAAHAQDVQNRSALSTDFFKTKIEIYVSSLLTKTDVDSAAWDVEMRNKIGYNFGVGIAYPLGKNFELVTRILHEQKGFRGSFGYSLPRQNFRLRNYYTTLNVMMNYWSGPRNNLGVGVGGYYGLLEKSKLTAEFLKNNENVAVTTFEIKKYETYDAGLIINMNYRISLTNQIQAKISLQEEIGMINLIKDMYTNESLISSHFYHATIKNKGFSANVGICINLPKSQRMVKTDPVSVKAYVKNFFSEVYFVGGPAIAFVRGNPMVETNSIATRKVKLAYNYAVGASHKIGDRYFFDVQILSENKGGVSVIKSEWYDEQTQSMVQRELSTKYNYKGVTMPFVFSYSPGDKARLKIGAGLFATYLAHVSDSYNPWTKKFDAGIVTSAQYCIPLTSLLSLNINAINTNGLLNVSRIFNHGVTMKTNCSSLLVGIRKKIRRD